MKKFLKSKKGIALLATMVVAIAAAMGAYAYFTSTGTKTDTPVTAGDVTNLDVQFQTEIGATSIDPSLTTYKCYNDPPFDSGCDALRPAGIRDGNSPVATVPFTIANQDESEVNLSSYTIKIPAAWSVDTDGAGGNPACTAADFSINNLPAGTAFDSSVGAASPASPAIAARTTLGQLAPLSDYPDNSFGDSFTVQLVDNNANQDNCKNATPDITISTTSS